MNPSKSIVLTAFLAMPTIVGLVGLWSGMMHLPSGSLEVRVFLTAVSVAVFVAYFAGSLLSRSSIRIGGTSTSSITRLSRSNLVVLLSGVCTVLFFIRFIYFIRSGGAALYNTSDALSEARLQLLDDAGVSGPVGRIYTVLSWAQFVLPVAVVSFWKQLSSIVKCIGVCASLFWPVLAAMSLGRLNIFIVAYIFLVFPLTSLDKDIFRVRPLLIRGIIIVSIVSFLFIAGALREFSGDSRKDRVYIKENALVLFDDSVASVLRSVPVETVRLGAAQLLEYSLSPWYYGGNLLSAQTLKTKPFTRSFYFISWPAVALQSYPELASRREAEFRFREGRGVPLMAWSTSIYDYVADFGFYFGSIFQVVLGCLAGLFSNRSDSSLVRTSFSCCLELAVFALPTFSIYYLTPIEMTVYISIAYIVVRLFRTQ